MDQRQSSANLLEPPMRIDSRLSPALRQPQVPPNKVAGPQSLRSTASAIGLFLLHFVEMVVAMAIGMAIFGPVKAALVDKGYTKLLDRTSLDYQVGMNLFMIVPMVLWMRVRGCTWGHGVGMAVAMVVPPACVLVL
jgi:hypothetical protein